MRQIDMSQNDLHLTTFDFYTLLSTLHRRYSYHESSVPWKLPIYHQFHLCIRPWTQELGCFADFGRHSIRSWFSRSWLDFQKARKGLKSGGTWTDHGRFRLEFLHRRHQRHQPFHRRHRQQQIASHYRPHSVRSLCLP